MKRKDSTATKDKISFDQVEEVLAGSGKRADALRLDSFEALIHIKRARLVQTRRERARVAERHGEQSEAVRRADRRMALEHRFLVSSRAERDRLKAPTAERDEQTWQLHGYVRDQDGFPRAGYTVALFPDADGVKPALMTTKTNKQGYFHFRYAPDGSTAKEKREKAAAYAAELRLNTNVEELKKARASRVRLLAQALRNPVYIGTQGNKQSDPSVQPQPLYPAPGMIAYRDITVDDPSDTGKRCHFATRLLGNSVTKELYDLDNEQPGFQLAAIRPDHRVYFLSEEQAQKLGYDYCGHCDGREKPKRNRR
jgi:hypothetical protein